MTHKKRRIAVLGATGSIGRQALQVITEHSERFEATLLTAKRSVEQIVDEVERLSPSAVLIEEKESRVRLSSLLRNSQTKVYPPEALADLLHKLEIDIVLVAMVGFAGLQPTLTAIEAGKPIALANKETLVAGGEIVMAALREKNLPIYPVDSEHSAIFQCLIGEPLDSLKKIILTASGGTFWEKSTDELHHIKPSQALQHPNWEMGPKVSVDSATMMNKGLEVIEAHWLFNLSPSRIEVLIHRQSLVHSLVEFVDGSQKAQIGPSDMRIPIQLALSYPERLPLKVEPLQLEKVGSLTFTLPDSIRFPSLPLCYEVIEKGGNFPCALNAANECAVEAFLKEYLPFTEIVAVVASCLEKIAYIAHPSYEELLETDKESRRIATELIHVWQA